LITIVNYGLGNIEAFVNIYNKLNIPVKVAGSYDELKNAEKLILPGVGAFDWAMTKLNDSGMRQCLDDLVVGKQVPVIGVCVGMQMMAHSSEEGVKPGLGWIDATVDKFNESDFKCITHLPHMGWNDVDPVKTDTIFKNLGESPRFYFLHSYYFSPKNTEDTLSYTDYNVKFSSAIQVNNIFGVQFHPEKSHNWGVKLLKNFAEIKICLDRE